jgi:hypothetical protein
MEINRKLFTLGTCLALFPLSLMAAPSAKFAATWGYGPSLESVAYIAPTAVDTQVFDENLGYTLARIKVPQDKELLVGVSAEIGIVTDTSIKGKNGGAAVAMAGGEAGVLIVAVPVNGGDDQIAEPGVVVLNKRVQTLSATLGGVIRSCTDFTGGEDINGAFPGDPGYIDTPDGTIDVATECLVTDEQIGLIIDTLSAHHFNFVLPDMDQGEYDIKAIFTTGALAEVDIDEDSVAAGGTVTAAAGATAFIGKHMVTVQQVRAVKDSLTGGEIVEIIEQ